MPAIGGTVFILSPHERLPHRIPAVLAMAVAATLGYYP
jgi:hypothetical protein